MSVDVYIPLEKIILYLSLLGFLGIFVGEYSLIFIIFFFFWAPQHDEIKNSILLLFSAYPLPPRLKFPIFPPKVWARKRSSG